MRRRPMMGRTCREWSCRSSRRPRQIHPVAAARCSDRFGTYSAVRGCLGSHTDADVFFCWWIDGCVSQRARESRRACVKAYEGFGCEQGLWLRGCLMCTLWRGQELAACFRTGSSSQSVAGVGLSVRKRASLICYRKGSKAVAHAPPLPDYVRWRWRWELGCI